MITKVIPIQSFYDDSRIFNIHEAEVFFKYSMVQSPVF